MHLHVEILLIVYPTHVQFLYYQLNHQFNFSKKKKKTQYFLHQKLKCFNKNSCCFDSLSNTDCVKQSIFSHGQKADILQELPLPSLDKSNELRAQGHLEEDLWGVCAGELLACELGFTVSALEEWNLRATGDLEQINV